MTLFLDASLLKHAKVQAIAEEISLTSLMERCLFHYLPKETVTKSAQTDKSGSKIKR